MDILGSIDFGARYYAYCDAHAGLSADPKLQRADYERVLNASGLPFKYYASERFFGHRDPRGAVTLALNAVISRKDLELVLAIIRPQGTLGGTFHGLSHRLLTEAQPDPVHTPKYPRLPFHSLTEFSAALDFGLGLYREALPLIVEQNWE